MAIRGDIEAVRGKQPGAVALIAFQLLDAFLPGGLLGGEHLAFDDRGGNPIDKQHNIRFDMLFILDYAMGNALFELVGNSETVVLKIIRIDEANGHGIFRLAGLERLLAFEPFAEFLIALNTLKLMNDSISMFFGNTLVAIQLDDGFLEIRDNERIIVGITEPI